MGIKRLVDGVYTYRFIKTLVQPWTKTDAYKLGLIDQRGNKLQSPVTNEEKNAYTFFHRVIFNFKRLLEKLPGNTLTRLASFASALALLSEATGIPEKPLLAALKTGCNFQLPLFEDTSIPLIENTEYTLAETIPVKVNESADFDAEAGSKVVVLGKGKVQFGQQFYEAVHVLSGQMLNLTESDVVASAAATTTTADVADCPRPLKTEYGDKYQHFKLPSSTFNNFSKGRTKYSRWNKFLDLNDPNQRTLSEFAKKHRDALIVIEDETTGARRAIRQTSPDGH